MSAEWMGHRQQRYFAISGEAILELIKEKFDLPADTELVTLIDNPQTPEFIDIQNTVRFLVESEVFSPVFEGNRVPRLELRQTEAYETRPPGIVRIKKG